jgi:hypothetical protein
MKAVLLYSYGDPSQLRYEETAMPNSLVKWSRWVRALRVSRRECVSWRWRIAPTRNTRSPKLTCSLRSLTL